MKRRFIIYRRKLGGGYYIEDTKTRKQESLGTNGSKQKLASRREPNDSTHRMADSQ
jgi:hypothetical protein